VGGRKGNEGVERETAGSHGEARSRARSSSGPMPKRRGEEMGGPGSTSAWGQEKKRGGAQERQWTARAGGNGSAMAHAGGAALSEQGSAGGL
jgi:hypothetical protein